MTLKTKSVSKRYALEEFKTVGFCIILYSLFALFFPLILNELPDIFGEYKIFGYNAYRIGHVLSLTIGTILPFFFLRLACGKSLKSIIGKSKLSIGEHLCNYLVFSVAIAGSIFVTMMLAQNVNVSGDLVSSIGIVLNQDYMSDVVYIVSFIIVTPIIEEYAFRGCLLTCLSRYGKYFALVATSIIYALAHGSFVEMIPAFFMNVILSKMTLRNKSIIPSIIVHIMYNFTVYALYTVPEKYALQMAIAIGLAILIAVVLVVSKKYKFVTVKKSNSNKQVTLTFLATFSVTLSMLLLILHSALLMVL